MQKKSLNSEILKSKRSINVNEPIKAPDNAVEVGDKLQLICKMVSPALMLFGLILFFARPVIAVLLIIISGILAYFSYFKR